MPNFNIRQTTGKIAAYVTLTDSQQYPLAANEETIISATVYSEANLSNKKSLFRVKPKILVIENNLIIQRATLYMLEALGCQIDVANNGIEALNLFKTNQYSLVFLNINLPDISGIEVAKNIRTTKRGKHLPLIAVSHSGNSHEFNCHKAGINDVFVKPVMLDGFRSILQQWLTDYQ